MQPTLSLFRCLFPVLLAALAYPARAHVDSLAQVLNETDSLVQTHEAEALPTVGRAEPVDDADASGGKAVALRGPGAGFRLDLGRLDYGIYVVYVAGKVREADAMIVAEANRSALVSSSVQTKPLFLTLTLNSGVGGRIERHTVRAPYSPHGYYEYMAKLFFHAPESREYQAELMLADPSIINELVVDRVELRNPLGDLAFEAIKSRSTWFTPEEVERMKASATAEGKAPPPLRSSPLSAQERAQRDDIIWNQSIMPLNAHPAQAVYPLSHSTSVPTVQALKKQLEAEGKVLGSWQPQARSYDQPFVLVNKELGLTYTLDDYSANRPLPSPWPFSEGKGLYYFDKQQWGTPISFNWGQIPMAITGHYQVITMALGVGTSEKVPNLPERYLLTGDQDAAEDGAFLLAAYAYRYPAYDYRILSMVHIFQKSRNFEPSHGNGRGVAYQGWSTGEVLAIIQGYDKLFPYISRSQPLADRVGRFVPWVKTPQDVVKLIDTFLVQRAAKDAADHVLYSNILPVAATVLGPSRPAEKYMDLYFNKGIYLRDEISGFTDSIVGSYSRDGLNYIGSTFYSVGESIHELMTVVLATEKWVRAGGDKRFDLSDPSRFPRISATAPSLLGLMIAGGHATGVGDVNDPAAAPRSWALLGPEKEPEVFQKGWTWTGDPKLAWVLANKVGQGAMPADQWEKVRAAATDERDPLLHSHSGVMEGYGIARLEEGSEATDLRHKNAIMLRFGIGSGHAHPDTLDLEVFAHGLRMSSDLGGRASGKYGRPTCMSTFVHNVVQVDDADFQDAAQNTTAVGWLQAFVPTPGAQFVMGSGKASAQPQVTQYTRGALQVLADAGDGKDVTPSAYVFDVFRVTGGKTHTWCFHGCVSDAFEPGADLRPAESETAATYMARHQKGTTLEGVTPDVLQATWRLRREESNANDVKLPNFEQKMLGKLYDPQSPRKYTRVHLLRHGGDHAMVGNWWSNAIPSRQHSLPMLYVRQSGQAQLRSVWPAVIEAYAGEPIVTRVQQLQLPGDDADDAVAVKVETRFGQTDVLYAGADAARTVAVADARLSGHVALVSRDPGGLRQALLVGGPELAEGGLTIRLAASRHATTIKAIHYDSLTATIEPPLPAILAGTVFTGGNSIHRTTRRISRIQGDRAVLARETATYQGGVSFISPNGAFAELDLPPSLFDYHPTCYEGMTVTNEAGQVLGRASIRLGDRSWYTGWPEARRFRNRIHPGDITDANGDGAVTVGMYVNASTAPQGIKKRLDDGTTTMVMPGEKMLDLEVTRVREDGLMFYTKQHPRPFLDSMNEPHPGWPYHQTTIRNEAGTREWLINMPGDTYRLVVGGRTLTADDFPDSNGDGRAMVHIQDIGPGDTLEAPAYVHLNRSGEGVYTVEANAGFTLSLPGREIAVSHDGGETWRTLAGEASSGRLTVQIGEAELGAGRLVLRIHGAK